MYNKVTNTILELNGAPGYVCTCDLLGVLIPITDWLNMHIGGIFLMRFPLGPPLTPLISCITYYGTLYTIVIQRRIFLLPRFNLDTRSDSRIINLLLSSSWLSLFCTWGGIRELGLKYHVWFYNSYTETLEWYKRQWRIVVCIFIIVSDVIFMMYSGRTGFYKMEIWI